MKQLFTNFSKGELGPQLYGRIDTSQYQAAAKRVRNFIIQRYGGLAFRPGFRFVGEADTLEGSVRYQPFQYSIDQAYIMAFADVSMRLLALGGFILEDDLKIDATSGEGEFTLLTIPFHGMSIGDRGYIDGIEGEPRFNNRFVEVVHVPNENQFWIALDSSEFEPITGSTGITRAEEPEPPPPPPPPPDIPPPPPPPPSVGGGGGSGSGLGQRNPAEELP